MITWQQETQSDMFLAAQVESGSSEMPTRVQSGYCLPLQESISGLARRKHSGILLGKEHSEESPVHASGAHSLVTLLAAVTRASFVSQDRVKLTSTLEQHPAQRSPAKSCWTRTSIGMCHRVNETIQPLSQCFMKWEEIHFLSVPSSIIKVLQ